MEFAWTGGVQRTWVNLSEGAGWRNPNANEAGPAGKERRGREIIMSKKVSLELRLTVQFSL